VSVAVLLQVAPFYLEDRKARISVARVDDRLYAFDDICTCADRRRDPTAGLIEMTSAVRPT
jgi:hypothetical protein